MVNFLCVRPGDVIYRRTRSRLGDQRPVSIKVISVHCDYIDAWESVLDGPQPDGSQTFLRQARIYRCDVNRLHKTPYPIPKNTGHISSPSQTPSSIRSLRDKNRALAKKSAANA